jgi:Flp pilus assembly protein TadD
MSATRWFYVQDEKRMGPVDMEQIVRLVMSGALPGSALVWHQGLGEWTEAEKVPELGGLLPPPLPPGKAEASATPARSKPAAAVKPAAAAVPAPTAAAHPAPGAAASRKSRADELRQKLEKDSSARTYAHVIEELRQAGHLPEAIAVCREGVQRYPAYPTLRLTLGKLLLDAGDLTSARTELEAVLQAAPDNILGERTLGECLEAMGDLAGARARYEAALALSPADAQLASLLRALDEKSGAEAPSRPGASAPPALDTDDPLAGLDLGPVPPPIEAPPPAFDGAVDAPPSRAPDEDLKPIPLVAVEEPFVIERAGDVAPWRPPTAAPAVKAAAPAAAAPSASPPKAATLAADAATKKALPKAPAPAKAAAPAPTLAPPPVPPAAPPAPRPPAAAAAAAPAGRVGWPSGLLADHEFADVVSEVHARRWSGLLTLNHMGVEKSIRVQDGRLVFASSSSRDDRLGELLLRNGRITLHQYVAASRALSKGKRLGAVLVEQGALDARELVKWVVDQTQEIIYSSFQWTEGHYHLTDTDVAAESITLRLSTPDVILEGIRRIDAWSRIEKAVGGLEARYVRATDYEATLDQMTLSLEKLSLLTSLAAEQDLGTICRQSTLTHFEVCRTLWAFRVIGLVRRLA